MSAGHGLYRNGVDIMHHTKRYGIPEAGGGRNACRCTRAPLFVALALLASLAILAAFAVQDGSDEVSGADPGTQNLNYEISDSTNKLAQVVNSPAASGAIEIPEKIDISGEEYTVTAVDARAFYKNTNITSVTLPKTVTSIGWDAFFGCGMLASADMPMVKSIGKGAFTNTLLLSVSIPMVKSIGISAFDGCIGLTSANMPNVTSIEEYAFQNCTSLAFLRFGPLETMAADAFYATGFSFKDSNGNDVPVGVGLKDKAWKKSSDSSVFVQAFKLELNYHNGKDPYSAYLCEGESIPEQNPTRDGYDSVQWGPELPLDMKMPAGNLRSDAM